MPSASSATDQPIGWPLWVVLFLVSALAFSTCSGSACAQERDPLPELPQLDLAQPCAPEVHEDRRRALLPHGAVPGIWFHGDIARCMLGRLTLLPLYVDRVRLLEGRVVAQDRLVGTLTTAEALSRQIADQASGALGAAVSAQRRAEEELHAWYRSPVLWFSAGALVVIAVVVGIFAGL